jgi:hypothetical protein
MYYYAYQYKLENRKTVVDSKTLAGRINITRYLENKQELETIENLATEDKHRNVLTFECIIGLL